MQLLLIHSDSFSWKVDDKAVSNAESLTDYILGEYRTEDSVMIIFIGIENVDTNNNAQLTVNAISEIQQALEDVKETNVILYPWVHLAKTIPAKPTDALRILQTLHKQLEEKLPDFNILRAPFGYYKSFSLHCKGHALAERSKEILSEKEQGRIIEPTTEVVTALKAEDEVESQFFILTSDGELTPHDIFPYKDQKELQIFVDYETAKDRSVSSPPKHVDLMKKLFKYLNIL